MRLGPFALLLFAIGAQAQTTLTGRVTDAATGEGLPAATIQVPGTSRGTVTNVDGAFALSLPAGADSVVVRFVGYETARRAVPETARLDVALDRVVASLGEAVVTAGNPADAVMRRVIERKARWRAGLDTWRADAYSRQTIRASGAVVAVIEAQTTSFWDRERGLREIVRATNRTGNLGTVPLAAFTAADQILNLYDDEVELGGFDLMGPTNPRALDFYRFEIVGRRAQDTQLVYDIAFAPRNPLQPGFAGTLSVLSGVDAMVAISVAPSDGVQFPLVNQFTLTFEQQFSSFGLTVADEPVWLPVDFRMNGAGRPGNALLRFPDLGFAIASRFTDYAVNVAVPDSLFERDGALVDSASVARGIPTAGVVPLSDDESRALVEIDSTQSLTEALRPRGPLARFFPVTVTVAGQGRGAAPRLRFERDLHAWYNRVEGAHLGGSLTARKGSNRLTVGAAYMTGLEEVSVEASAVARLSPSVFAGVDAHREVARIGRSIWVSRPLTTVAALVAGEDYYDYVEQLGGSTWVGWWGQAAPFPNVRLGAALDDLDAAPVTTTFSLTGAAPRTVLDVPSSVARADLRFRVGRWDEGPTSALTGQRGATLWVEGGQRWDGVAVIETARFGRVEGEVRWSQPTVLRRRLLAPTLHLRLAAGAATGPLPITRAFAIDGRVAEAGSFGALRARSGQTLVQRYALVAWEHDFRSVPFELLGWRGAAPRGVSFQIHGAHAWGLGADGAVRVAGALGTEPRLVHHEVGASVGLGFSLPVRLDVTYRLTDTPGVVVGIGLARLF